MTTVTVSEALPNKFAAKPKPTETIESTSSTESSSANGNIPQAYIGSPVAAVLGRKRVSNPNVIWTGNLRPLTEVTTSTQTTTEEFDEEVTIGLVTQIITTTKTTTAVTTTTTIVGYLVDIHMGICLGPDVHLVAIYCDNAKIWEGDAGAARETFTIGENNTFLSEASCVFSGGAYDQAPEPLIDVPNYPGYVGIATLLMQGVRADLSMGNLSFEVVRIPNPLGIIDTANRIGDDLNVVSAIVEVATNEWGWGSLDISDIDVAGMSVLAATLAVEENMCSVKIETDTSLPAILDTLLDQAAMLIYQHPDDGLIHGALIRADYIDYVALGKRFTMSNIIELRNFEKTSWKDTIEQARGKYTERDNEYNEVSILAQNMANISQSGRGRSTATLYYAYVPNADLCAALLSRDLAAIAAPTYGFSLLTNRDGAALVPGDMITVTWPDYDILNEPMCVMRVRKQDIYSNNVTLTLRQMKYPDTTPLFANGSSSYDPGFDLSPVAPTSVAFITAPYFFARAQFGVTSKQTSPVVYPAILPVIANEVQYCFGATLTNKPSASGDTELIRAGLYPTYALLNGAIGAYDAFDDGILTSITIDGVVNGINLIDIGNDGVRDGRLFIIIGNEIMSFESAVDNSDGTWTLNNVHRALLDTVFEAHADNATVFIVGNNFNYVAAGFSYPLGYTPAWAITSNSLAKTGAVADGLVSSAWAPDYVRTLCPPRPHNTKINATARSSAPVAITEGDSVTVTWLTRARTADGVSLMLDAADTAEVNGASTQKHRVFHRSAGGTETELGAGPYTGNSATFTMPNVADGAGSIFVQAEITLGGVLYTSKARDYIPVTISPAP